MKRRIFICLFLCWFAMSVCPAQNSGLETLRAGLDELALRDTSYNRKVDVAVTNFSIAELVKGLAIANGLSIDVNFDKRKSITCNLIQQPVKDVLYFICSEKNIAAEIVGDIVTLSDFVPPVPAQPVNLVYDEDSSTLSFDFSSCRLDSLSRRFSYVTGVNMIVPNSIVDREVSGFGRDLGLDDAVKTIAMVNSLYARQENGRDWILSKENRNPKVQQPDKPSFVVSVYPMRYRAVNDIVDIIPAEMKQGVEIKTFHDLNSLVISGEGEKCDRITSFLDEVDKSVPLVSIDVIIVDATNTNVQTMGLGFGVGAEDAKTSGTVGKGVDVTLNAESLNGLLAAFTGWGPINLGPVTSMFYADLQLLEESGKIVLRSTPRLATLNGHKATLKSGEVKYYKESQVNIIGTQNPLQSESYLWKNVEASFVLDITPHVSCDSTITMDISLSQDEFTSAEEGDQYAPPGISKRSFNSIIKVKNGEMVLLGGIEKNLSDNSADGLPFIARIPILRLFFGKTHKEKTDSKLNIFIKPTIIQ